MVKYIKVIKGENTMNYNKSEIIKSIEENKLIAILRGVPQEKLLPLVEALYKGGIRLLELTYSADGSTPDEVTAQNIKMLSENFNGRMFIGAGTVLTTKQVKLTEKNGGCFIISPDANENVIKETVNLGMVSIPGALTPTEITQAHNFGADFVKLFPISNLGAAYVKAVTAPLSHIKLLAVGGVTTDNMHEYSKSGACGFGIGANLYKKELLENNDFEAITEIAREFVSVAKNA